jgi:hypothetical protein
LFKRFLAQLSQEPPSECGGNQQHSKRHKGEMMKNHCVRILSAFLGLAGLGAAAHGQVSDQLSVNIPYEFVVAGKTLPAGSYRISRANGHDDRVLLISSFENHASALVLATEIVDATAAAQPGLSFQEVGEQHLLGKIQTADHLFTIRVSDRAVLEAAAKSHGNPSMGAPGASK